MTNERAVELLRRLQDEQFDGQHGDERREALSMAVRALEGDGDTISRKMAIDVLTNLQGIIYESDGVRKGISLAWNEILKIPPAQPERLTDDDFEAIRIHLNAYKEKLCNQQRWKEAEEYQRIIDRFMEFASARQEYEPVTAEDFAKTMSENTLYQYMAWHGEALALMKEQGFVICKKAM